MARAEFSKKTKAQAFVRSKGRCETEVDGKATGGCGMKILGTPEYDHIIEAALGGSNKLENCACLCAKCHKFKTAERRYEMDKTRRTSEKQRGLRKKKGRPMAGTKASGWKQKMDGTWERRR